jgi:hypothetical protein
VASTKHGGHDRGEHSLRYLEWTFDPDTNDTTYESYMVYLLREDGEVRSVLDRHTGGLFSHQDWLRLIAEAGFEARSTPFDHSEIEPGSANVFVGRKPLVSN